MQDIETLKAELAVLQAEVEKLIAEGRVLTDCWIAKAKPGKSEQKKYYRLKSRKPIFNGKKTEYLSIQGTALAEAQAAIARGQQIKKLQRRIEKINQRIQQWQQASVSSKKKHRQRFQEWSIAPEFMTLVRQVLGEIDLDPASTQTAQVTIQAATYYTLVQRGLTQSWFGRVWLHPPQYAKIGKWVNKVIAEYEAGHVTEAVVLVKAAVGSKWFQRLSQLFSICLPKAPIPFRDELGNPQETDQGYMIFYLGANPERFKSVFSTVGSISSPCHPVVNGDGLNGDLGEQVKG